MSVDSQSQCGIVLIHRHGSHRLRDGIWCNRGGAQLSGNVLVDSVEGGQGDIVKINHHRGGDSRGRRHDAPL